jgi:hypothetical protein
LLEDEIVDAMDIYRRYLSSNAELPVELPIDIAKPLDERLISTSAAAAARLTLSLFDATIRHVRTSIATLRRPITR